MDQRVLTWRQKGPDTVRLELPAMYLHALAEYEAGLEIDHPFRLHYFCNLADLYCV